LETYSHIVSGRLEGQEREGGIMDDKTDSELETVRRRLKELLVENLSI